MLAAALATASTLGGCSAAGDVLSGSASSEPNATDAAFARAMVVNQRAVGSIAELGSRKALRNELRRISRRTLARNGRHMPALVGSHRDLRKEGVSRVGGGIGEPPAFDKRALRDAVSFDHDFLAHMIDQLEYATRTAAVQRERGGDARLRLMAAAIHESSRRDLAMLRRWLRQWYGDDTQRGPGTPPPGGGGGGTGPGPPV